MLKYTDIAVTFREVPNEISLCINISGCPIHCPDCHSKELWEDVGKNLTSEVLNDMIEKHKGITCVCFMGGDSHPEEVNELAKFIKRNLDPNILTCWYSGKETLTELTDLEYWDFIKLGPYIKERGGLDNPNTNQKFYEVKMTRKVDKHFNPIYTLEDITNLFQKNASNI